MSGALLGLELSYWQLSILRSLGVLVAVLIPAGTRSVNLPLNRVAFTR